MSGKQFNNDENSEKRIKFRRLADRLEKISVNVDINKLTTKSKISEESIFVNNIQNELDTLKELDATAAFKRFYYKLWPLIQSLPEIIHHLKVIVTLLVDTVASIHEDSLPSILALVSMLCRDIPNEMQAYFSDIMKALVDRVYFSSKKISLEIFSPELVGKIIECMSHVLKYQLQTVLLNADQLLQYYGGLLGHHIEFVRTFSAKCFSLVIKAFKAPELKRHLKKFLKAVGNVLCEFVDKKGVSSTSLPVTAFKDDDTSFLNKTRLLDLLHGVSLLLFYSCKGVKGCLHSKFIPKLQVLFEVSVGMSNQIIADIASTSSLTKYTDLLASFSNQCSCQSFAGGFILRDCISKLFHHTVHSNIMELWLFVVTLIGHLESYILCYYQIISSNHYENAAAAVLYACEYIIEIALYSFSESNFRKISALSSSKNTINTMVAAYIAFLKALHAESHSNRIISGFAKSALDLFSRFWTLYPSNEVILGSVAEILPLLFSTGDDAVVSVCGSLLKSLPSDVVREHLMSPLIYAVRQIASSSSSAGDRWIPLLLQTLQMSDVRKPIEENVLFASQDGYSDLLRSVLERSTGDILCLFDSAIVFIHRLIETNEVHERKETVYLACLLVSWMSQVLGKQLKGKQAEKSVMRLSGTVHEFLLVQSTIDDSSVSVVSSLLYLHCALTVSPLFVTKFSTNKNADWKELVVHVTALFIQHPQSIIFSWAYRALLEMLVIKGHGSAEYPLDGVVTKDVELSLFEAIVGCLGTGSHWLRVNLLKILHFFPPPLLVVREDKAGDEEEAYDVVACCLDASLLEVSLESAREFSRLVGNLEVVIRSERLPAIYVRLIMSVCLGLMQVKFQPYWEPLTLVIIASAGSKSSTEGDSLWLLLLASIEEVGFARDMSMFSAVSNDTIETVHELVRCDSGILRLSEQVTESVIFPFASISRTEMSDSNVFVAADARADQDTMFSNMWGVLKRCPDITLRRSKVVVPIFLRFLRDQYYAEFIQDTEVSDLISVGVLLPQDEAHDVEHQSSLKLPRKSLKVRLEVFLSVFAAVVSPKQLYQHRLLFHLFVILTAKSDTKLSKLALDCVFTYKPSFLSTIKENVYRIADDKKIRDELVNFDITASSEVIAKEHHSDVISFLSFILYSKFSARAGGSKSNRDQGIARRNAVLAFLCQIEGEHLVTFLHLLLRGILPGQVFRRLAVSSFDNVPVKHEISFRNTAWWQQCRECVDDLTIEEMETVSADRHIAFMHFVEHLTRVLGHRLDSFIGVLLRVVLLILARYSSYQDVVEVDVGEEDEEDERDETQPHGPAASKNQYAKARSLCLSSLADFVEIYGRSFDFGTVEAQLMDPLDALIEALPSAVRSSSKPPALLKLFRVLVANDSTIALISSRPQCIRSIIQCLSARTDGETSKIISEMLLKLLAINQGDALLPHVDLLVNSFCRRFLGDDTDQNVHTYNLSELNISPSGSIKQELALLFNFAEVLFKKQDLVINNNSILNLATLLLGMLRTYINSRKVRVEEEWVLNILSTYQSLLPRLQDVMPHVPFISRMFGPALHTQSLMNQLSVRKKLVDIYGDISTHPSAPPCLRVSADALNALTAMDKKLIDARDFSACIPLLQGLSGEVKQSGSVRWSALLGPSACETPRMSTCCQAIVHECMRSLYDPEILVRGAVIAALKKLVDETGQWSGLFSSEGEKDASSSGWFDVVTSVVMPGIHKGLKQGADATRKGFIQLLAHIVKVVGVYPSLVESLPQLHGDLFVLLNVDLEQDFFENIVHIQHHRRLKALSKVRNMLNKGESLFTVSSYTNVLLSIGYHILTSDDFIKKEGQVLVMEAAQFIGAVAMHLPWSQYLAVIKYLLKQLDQHNVERERLLLNALCNVLDAFHFDMSVVESSHVVIPDADSHTAEAGEDEGGTVREDLQKTNIANCVMLTVLPWVRVFLLKDEKDNKGNDSKTVRPLVAVALAKLIGRLQPPIVSELKKQSLLENLILNIVGVLKSRDSSARDAARDSLARIVASLGIASLHPVLYELDKNLQEGYQRHVRNYSIRSLLFSVKETYAPPKDYPCLDLDTDVLGFHVDMPAFDKCIPIIVSSATEDLIGNAQEDRETDDAKRTLIREAKGSKSNEILETCAKCILFRPSYALINKLNAAEFSSVHALVSPFLEILSTTENKVVIGRIGEALQRVSLGLSKNESLIDKEVLLYIYSSLAPLLRTLLESQPSDEGVMIPSYLCDDSDEEEERLGFQNKKNPQADKMNKSTRAVNTTWLPHAMPSDQRSAIEARDKEREKLTKVEDGFSAPKLTGVNRHKRMRDEAQAARGGDNAANPATLAAIKFCLSLFYFCLKQQLFDSSDKEICSMVSPFLDMLMTCLKISGASDIVASTMRCLAILLTWEGITINASFSKALASRILKLMFRGGALISTDNDLVQVCLKGLNALFKLGIKDSAYIPIKKSSIRDILQMLTVSVMQISSAYQNTAFQLIRTIVELKIVLPEVYDIVSQLCDQIVLSHRKSIRESSASIISAFLLHYPLGDKKLLSILKRVITNCSYEYEDGRQASIDLLGTITKVLPVPILEEHCQFMFLPITLRLINETSTACRQACSAVLTTIVRRVGLNMANTFVGFVLKWFEQVAESVEAGGGLDDNCRALIGTAAQITAVLAEGRSECFKRVNATSVVMESIAQLLPQFVTQRGEVQQLAYNEANDAIGSVDDWVLTYYLVHAVESLYTQLSHQVDTILRGSHIFELIQEAVLYPHSWVRAAACRVVLLFLTKNEMSTKTKKGDPQFLFHVARRMCAAINQNIVNESLLEPVISALLISLGSLHTQNALMDDPVGAVQDAHVDEDDEGLAEAEDTKQAPKNGAFWIIRRLCGIANSPHGQRRLSVLKVFGALVLGESKEFLLTYVKYILEIVAKTTASKADNLTEEQQVLLSVATEVQENLERKIGSIDFNNTYLEIQQRLSKLKLESKQKAAIEAVLEPREFAIKKIENLQRKKFAMKRKFESGQRKFSGGINDHKKRGRNVY